MKRRRFLHFGIFLFLVIGGVFFYHPPFAKTTYHDSWAVRFTNAKVPYVNAEIEGKPCTLAVDLGSRFALGLEKDVLDTFQKKPSGKGIIRDAYGNRYEVAKYILPKIKIGTAVWTNVKTREKHSDFMKNVTFSSDSNFVPKTDTHGDIGLKMLTKYNLLMDFSRSVMYASNDFDKLNAEGYPVETWFPVPIKRTKYSICLDVQTDAGLKRFSLDTGATITFIRASEVQDKIGEKTCLVFKAFTSKKFEIAGRDLGSTDLYLFNISEELDDCNGTIGMDILGNQACYFDFKNEIAYFDFDHPLILRFPYHFKIGGGFTPEKIPYVNAEIEGGYYPMGLDFKFTSEFALDKEILEKIEKKLSEHPFVYGIPKIQLSGLALTDMIAIEHTFLSNTLLKGKCGWKLLKRFNFLIDYPRSTIYMSNILSELEQEGYSITSWIKVPFKMTSQGIFFDVTTSFGRKKLLLNTAEPKTLIHFSGNQESRKAVNSLIFKMGKYDFGSIDLYPAYDITECDGVLGMDFLSRQPVYFDLIRNCAYFGPSSK
jgi:hypothetical protein